jgi:hypothetical protein
MANLAKKKIAELKRSINLLLSEDMQRLCNYNDQILRRKAYTNLNTLRNSLHRHLSTRK